VLNGIPVSVLDTALVLAGKPASEALSHSVAVTREAERLGFRRFWVAEHHGSPAFASVAPVLVYEVEDRLSSLKAIMEDSLL
jgi:hypothetical protein